VPSKVRTSGDVAPLDRVLVEMAILEPAQVQESVAEIMKTGELHGRYLVQKGLVEVGAITGALQWQLIRKIGYMLKLPPQTSFAYYDQINMLEEYGGPQLTPADPLAMIMTGVRVLGRAPIVTQTLSRLGQTPLRIRREADIRRLHLKEPEQRVLDLLRSRPMTINELLSKQVAVPLAIELTIYALMITRCLNLGANQKPPVGYGVATVALRWDPGASPGRPSAAGQGPPGRPSRPGAAAAGRPSRPGAQAPQSNARPNMRRGTSTRGTGAGRGSIPRRGTSSTRASQPLPRRGTSSARGQPLPRRGTSSAHGQPLPRHGEPAQSQPVAGAQHAPAPAASAPGPLAGQGLAPRQGAEPRPAAFQRADAKPAAFERHRAGQTPPEAASRAPSRPSSRGAQAAGSARRGSPSARGARGGASPSPQAAVEQAPPGSLQRDEIERRVKLLDEQTYFQILGIDEKADANAVQSAYFQLAKSWHPDRLHSSLTDMKAKVAMVFARVNEAYQTLSNAEKRAEYEDTVKHGGGTAKDRQMVERVIDSALLFQKGEVVFRKGSYEQAAEMVRKAADADPDQPEYRALLAWIEAHCLGQPPEGADDRRHFYRDQIKMLDVVIKQEPEYERALFYRGSLLKRSGFAEAALKDFRKVVQLNPRNIDAAREVRLNQLRNKKEDKGGIFGRFFGKDKDK
jgi:curved DNA-binding protein CbpA